ncbi:hypothetical protein CN386_00325 [Bacillus cereus]|nr:hypothetical protein CN386_00325 [Bacillus cereus]PGT57635.1 hypothetical protein COD14_27625 [Bacillus cereus]PGV91518.1 hypothetical protein COD86_23110 [Bacillus cereus]
MKVSELIKHLQEIPNKDADVLVQYFIAAKKSDKVIPGMAKVDKILIPADGKYDSVCISSGVIEEDI